VVNASIVIVLGPAGRSHETTLGLVFRRCLPAAGPAVSVNPLPAAARIAEWEAPTLDITGDDPLNQHGNGGGPISLREVLAGMIEEHTRHMSHADLMRERIDGRIGQ
jgi:Protein of unknown function (DUF664)